MGRHRSTSDKVQKQSAFEKVTLGVGLITSLLTFSIGIIAAFTGFFVLDDKLKNIEEKAAILLKESETYKKQIEIYKEESGKHAEQLSKTVQQIGIGKNFSDFMSIGFSDDYVKKVTDIAKDDVSNNIRRADALLELNNQNFETALILWEKVLEYDNKAADAIYFCSILSVFFALENKDINRLLEGRKYLKNIPEDAIEAVFRFIDFMYANIDLKQLNYTDEEKFYKYTEWIYRNIEDVKQSFKLYYRWASHFMHIYYRLRDKQKFYIDQAIEKCLLAEKFIERDQTIPERIQRDFYIMYSAAIVENIFFDKDKANQYWDESFKILDKVKNKNSQYKLTYALRLRDKTYFYAKISEDDFKKSIQILEELQTTNMRKDAMQALGIINYFIYKNKQSDLEPLIKAEEYMRATLSFSALDVDQLYFLMDALYILASKVDDKRAYQTRVNYIFYNLQRIGYTPPEIFEYKIKFMILFGDSEEDILSAFSTYNGPLPQTILFDNKFKKFIDATRDIRQKNIIEYDNNAREKHLQKRPNERKIISSSFKIK